MTTTQRHDRIVIKDLLVRGILGINPEERVNRQDILINLELECDTRGAAETDQIDDALNYRSLTKRVIQHVESSRDLLVERLAHDLANLVLTEFQPYAVRLRIEKPGALRFARSVGVEIYRVRSESVAGG